MSVNFGGVGFLGYTYKSTKKSWHGSDPPPPFLVMPGFSMLLLTQSLPKWQNGAMCYFWGKFSLVAGEWYILLENYHYIGWVTPPPQVIHLLFFAPVCLFDNFLKFLLCRMLHDNNNEITTGIFFWEFQIFRLNFPGLKLAACQRGTESPFA